MSSMRSYEGFSLVFYSKCAVMLSGRKVQWQDLEEANRGTETERRRHPMVVCQQGGGNTWEDREEAGWPVPLLCNMARFCKVRSQSVQSPGLGFPMKNLATWLAREGWRMRQEFCQNHSSTSQCGMRLPRYRAILQSTKCPELKSAQLKGAGNLMDETLHQVVFRQLKWKI